MTGPFELRHTPDDSGSTPGPPSSRCPGCGLVLPEHDGPTHPYIGTSPACWALYGQLIAREFNEPTYFVIHQMTTDTYAVQHPGVPERRSIQSVAIHLMTLCLFLEEGADPRDGPKLHKRMVERPAFHWLEPPQPNGNMTIADVLSAEDLVEHKRLVTAWARGVWKAWTPHHETVRAWIDHSLG